MATDQKYSELPGLDTAPDTYETEATSDQASDISEPEPSTEEISHTHLSAPDARAAFAHTRVDAQRADFSDRLGAGTERGYLVSRGRRRRHPYLPNDDDDDDDDPESFAERLARLRLEAEELRALAESTPQDSPDAAADVAQLTSLLASLEAPTPQPQSKPQPTRPIPPEQPEQQKKIQALPADYTAALRTATQLEARLSVLETALGVHDGSLAPYGKGTSGSQKPLVPALALLERQVSALASTSGPALEALERQIRAVGQEASRRSTEKQAARSSSSSNKGDSERVEALYKALPTIEALAPVVPAMLERLRTLRGVHADAAGAAEVLASLERRLDGTAGEIQRWEEALQKMEGQVQGASKGREESRGMVEGWVRDLEARMGKIGS